METKFLIFCCFPLGEVFKNLLVPDEELVGGLRKVDRVQKIHR
jgi:hypothetical protein